MVPVLVSLLWAVVFPSNLTLPYHHSDRLLSAKHLGCGVVAIVLCASVE